MAKQNMQDNSTWEQTRKRTSTPNNKKDSLNQLLSHSSEEPKADVSCRIYSLFRLFSEPLGYVCVYVAKWQILQSRVSQWHKTHTKMSSTGHHGKSEPNSQRIFGKKHKGERTENVPIQKSGHPVCLLLWVLWFQVP